MSKIWKEVKKHVDKIHPSKVEYIVCAAIRVIEEKSEYPCVENKNIKIGLAHSDIINANQYSDRKVYTQDGQKGFLTSELNFVFREEAAKITGTNKDDTLVKQPKKRADAKVYPNDPCPCGSGKKYKMCCGK